MVRGLLPSEAWKFSSPSEHILKNNAYLSGCVLPINFLAMCLKEKLSTLLLAILTIAALASCKQNKEVLVTSITLSPDKVELVEGSTQSITATIAPEDATDKELTWTSSDQAVASVDADGLVTALKVGSATISASADGKTGNCTVTVVAKTISVTSIKLSDETISLNAGESKALTVTIEPDNATNKNVTWKSDDEAIATVDGEGNVTAVTGGSAKITATTEDGGLTASCTVTVIEKELLLYAVGQEAVPNMYYYYATVWNNGKRTVLSDGSYDAFCNGIYADGETIYVVGCEATGDLVDDGYYEPYHQNVGVIWKFKAGEEDKAEKAVISDGKYATSPIAVTVANGKVYVAGFDTPVYDRRVILWTDGTPQYLTDGSSDALAYCIFSDGNDVYVGGYIQPADNKQGGIATIWKNGVAQSLTSGNTIAKVNAIYVEDGKIYAAGAEKESGGKWKGVLWIDGVAQDFTDYVGTEVTGLYVKNGEYIIEGNMTETGSAQNICPYIWTSKGAQKIADLELCQGVGLAVDGNDIYVAGNEVAGYDSEYNLINHAHIWKNGIEQDLEVKYKNDFSLWGITCVYADKK